MILNNSLSLVCLDTVWYNKTIYAIERSMECIEIDKIYWFSDIPCPKQFDIPCIWVEIPKMTPQTYVFFGGVAYTRVMPKVIDTDYALYIHSDGFAVNKDAWDDRYLDYDYIGAAWPWRPKNRVGNGGFSLRSRKFHNVVASLDLKDEWLQDHPEDHLLCHLMGDDLRDYHGIKFAPEELACKFSMENVFDYPKQMYNSWLGKSFGFHNEFLCEYYGYKIEDLKG